MASVNCASLNCRGLADVNKRRDVLNYLREKKYSIIFLQDIHVTDQDVGILRAQWAGYCRLLRALINRTLEAVLFYLITVLNIYKVNKSKCDEHG